MEPAIQSNVNGVETCAMETQDIVKGIAVVSNEGISAGANTTDCAVVLAAICEQTVDMMTDGEASENDAGCVVADENVVRTVLRLNDEVSADDKSRHVLKLWHVLDAKGELRLNDFEYDSVDCGESWVIVGLDTAASSVCPQTDARRDPRWGWVPHDAPLLCGRVKMPMRDAMGNVWTTCYINGSFSSRHLNREVTEEEKMAMACPTPAARCFSPPLRNPVELEVAEGKVFAGDHGYTYSHARGKDATADGITALVWDPFNLNPDVLAAIDIAAHVIPEGQLQQHVAPHKYGYRVNWIPGCLQPTTVDGKVTMAAKLQTGHWLPLGWMHAGMVEQWQFLVVVARVSIFNADVKDRVLVVEHAKRCWEKIREEDRQMVCMGYESMPDQGMWSMVEGSPGGQGQGDGENRYMAHIRRRHGCSALVGWVPAVCCMTYEQGGEMMMRFRDPLGVPFLLTYSDGLLRDIRYMVAEDTRGGHRRPGQTEETRPGHQDGLSTEVEGPCGGERVAGCSASQGDVTGPSKTVMSHSPRKVKTVVSRPRKGKTAGDKQKKNPRPVPQTGNNADAPARVHIRRRHPGMTALTKIRKLQRSTDLCIPFRPFLRVVREVMEKDITPNKGLRFQMTAVRSLMEAVEAYLVANFENTNEVAIHSKRGWDMLVEGANDELKRGAAETLVLSRIKDMTQTPPQDFQELPVIVADGVEYVLLDQLCDLMNKTEDDRNVIHEALHEVTEYAMQGRDLIDFVLASAGEEIISGRPLWGGLLGCALERLGLATCDVERQREREEGWRLIVSETRLPVIEEIGETSAAQDTSGTMVLDVFTMHTSTTEDLVYMDMCEGFFLGEQQLAERRDDAEHIDDAEEQENDAAHDPGPSNIGAANLVGDESEDAGAEDDANGAAGDNAEPAAQPVEPFDSSRRLAALIFSARGGVGMSHTDVHALLSLLKDPRFNATDIAYCNSRECFAWASSLAEAVGWKELDLRNDDWPREAHAVLWHRDWRTAFLSIMHVALQKCETVHSLEVSPPSEDNSVSVETIDIRGSDDRHSGSQVEEEEEHDRSAPEKSDGAEDEEPGNEGNDSDSFRRQSQDTDEDDDSDGKSASERTSEDQSAASERGGSPFPSRTLRREGDGQACNGSDTEERVGDRQIVQHVSAAGKEDAFFAAVQATTKLAGETAEEGLRSHIAECGIRVVIRECNRMMTTIRGEITWQLKHWFWAEKRIPLIRSQQTDHHLPARNKMRTEMKENKTWRRSGDDPWGAPAFKTALLKVFQMRKEGRNLGVTLQQLAFAEMVIQCEIEQTTKTTRVAEQIEKLVSIKQAIVSSLRSRDTVMSFSVFKLDRSISVAEKATTLFHSGTPSVHRPGSPSTTITDDDYDIEFILPQSTAAGNGDRRTCVLSSLSSCAIEWCVRLTL
ncbi:hypothetical protein CBR_g58786 [Chara braunii]|uniref:Core Histone H2A/H2B/H3 domain-containing protein n=1 Tax=Chara braunii TaxID=69332 RepID=A0A388K8B1_CHABU|nr:hypothetical protein CBR_g58786 [Chara braunii]|eukprot:GBG66295.1 hypothetical protein CBR_g58786 [Chara braunii]